MTRRFRLGKKARRELFANRFQNEQIVALVATRHQTATKRRRTRFAAAGDDALGQTRRDHRAFRQDGKHFSPGRKSRAGAFDRFDYGRIGNRKRTRRQINSRIFSRAPDNPFVVVNCSNIPSELLESELFGHTKGAFTGAVAAKKGLFEVADGGSIFLDEIGDLRPETQVRLLRVIQEREFTPIGDTTFDKG